MRSVDAALVSYSRIGRGSSKAIEANVPPSCSIILSFAMIVVKTILVCYTADEIEQQIGV